MSKNIFNRIINEADKSLDNNCGLKNQIKN